MNRFINHSVLLVLLAVLASCSSTRELSDAADLPKVKDEQITAVLDSLSGVQFDYFYSKVSTKFQDSSQNVSFKTSIRMVKDSAVNAMITFAKIPIINALITPDSITVTNKRDKCVVLENLGFFKEKFGVEFNYGNIEELFFGQPVGYQAGETYHRISDKSAYTVCSHKPREIRKNERKDQREIITYYTVSDDLQTLQSMQIISAEDSTMIDVVYKEREQVDEYRLPALVDITIYTPKQQINVELEYKKTRVHEPEPIHFVIPESYEKCE